jgi:hypothetical protein
VWCFAIDGKAQDFHGAVTVPSPSALARYLSTANKFDRLGFARGRQHIIANSKLFNVDFALRGLYSRTGEEAAMPATSAAMPMISAAMPVISAAMPMISASALVS